MAYQQPPAGYPPYGVPSPGRKPLATDLVPHQKLTFGKPDSPQPGYHQPPPSQYQPQGYSPYSQERGYIPPPGQYPPQNYPPQGYPQQGYPPPPAIYNQNQGAYSQNQGYPPQGYPPPQQPYGAPTAGYYQPQQPPYGAQQQGYGLPQVIPTPPSLGYGPETVPYEDTSMAADTLRKAFRNGGFPGTDEAAIIRTLAHMSATSIPHLKTTYQQRHHRSLESDMRSETSFNFKTTLLTILRGPLYQDVLLLNKALNRAGTNEDLLDEVLLGRSNADIHAIKHAYFATYHKTLESVVSSDLSGKTDRLFSMVLAGTRQEDSAPVIPQAIDADVTELHHATEKGFGGGTDQLTVCSILTSRSDGQIRAIANVYEQRYRSSLEKMLVRKFSGHMEHALVQIVRAATDRAMRDAMLLYESMVGLGTKDKQLIGRVVAYHWNREHMGQVKGAFRVKYGKDLVTWIKKETSGDYERLLVAMVQ